MEALAGVPAEQVLGRHVLEVFPFLREVGVVGALERALEGEVVSIPEIPYRVPESGRQGWTAATFGPLRDVSGAIIGVIGSVQDVTAHKQEEAERGTLEAQLRHAQRMESIGRLAGGVAHDFNNLLSPIMVYAEMLQMHLSPGDPNREPANQILQAAERARDLTRQLLAFSRKQVLALTLVDLRSVVAGFEKLLRRTLREDVRIVFHLPPVLGTVHADAGQIEQVLMNLAVNAQDAMPGGGTFTLALANVHLDGAYAAGHPGVTPGPYVLLAASDTGIGMDPATQSRLFEPFFTTKEQGKGTGLGLSTVYGIIKQHRGHLWVDSELGRGTTFRIYLPQVEDLAITPSALPGGTAPLPRGSETVLVVENNPAVREMVCQVLELHGYRVLVADSGTRGLEVSGAHQGPIDLLLTAVILPDLNGLALYEHLAVSRPGLKAIYMSGYSGDVLAHHGVLDDGILLQKPFPMHTLLQKIREILAG
jgi:PAS domain S-box-containing protein